MAVREIVDYIENGNIRNSVNLPNVEMAISGNAKICVIHKNAEGLLNNITAPVSAAGLNIENMVSKSKKDYAYTCLDVKGDASGIEAAIKAVSGVVSDKSYQVKSALKRACSILHAFCVDKLIKL